MSSDAIRRNDQTRGSLWWLFWAALAVFGFAATAYFSGRERQYVEETVRLRGQLESATAQLAEWQQAPAIVNAPGSIEAHLTPSIPNEPTVRLFVAPGNGIVLVATHLPPAPAGKTYQMWLIGRDKKVVAAGIFQAQNDGSAIHVARNAAAPSTGAAVEVTLEDTGGAATPSAAPVISVSLPTGMQR